MRAICLSDFPQDSDIPAALLATPMEPATQETNAASSSGARREESDRRLRKQSSVGTLLMPRAKADLLQPKAKHMRMIDDDDEDKPKNKIPALTAVKRAWVRE